MFKMSMEAAQKLKDFNEEQKDWYGWCRKCGVKVEGSLKELREHKCEVN